MVKSKNVPIPIATRITIRLPHSLADRLREGAERDGVSVNQYILYLLAQGVKS